MPGRFRREFGSLLRKGDRQSSTEFVSFRPYGVYSDFRCETPAHVASSREAERMQVAA